MKKIVSLILICVLVFSLASCMSARESFSKAADDGEVELYYDSDVKLQNTSVSVGTTMDYVTEDSTVFEEAESDEPMTVAPPDTATVDTRKIIYTSSYTIETKEYNKSAAELEKLCEELGAWFESSNSHGTAESGNRASYYTVRVPVENLKAFVSGQKNIGTVVSSSENNRDVTEQYTDTEARLESALLREKRVLVILENAASLDDVLALERELSDIRYEIESLTGSLRKYDSLVQYSTVDITLREVSVYSPKAPVTLTFSERIEKAFKSGLENFKEFGENFVIFIIYNFISLVFWIAVIALVIILVIRKLKKNKKQAPADIAEKPVDEEKKD